MGFQALPEGISWKLSGLMGENKQTNKQNLMLKKELMLKKLMLKGGGGGKYWDFGISWCELLYIVWISSKALLYSTGN